jgi:hypothetical protein
MITAVSEIAAEISGLNRRGRVVPTTVSLLP